MPALFTLLLLTATTSAVSSHADTKCGTIKGTGHERFNRTVDALGAVIVGLYYRSLREHTPSSEDDETRFEYVAYSVTNGTGRFAFGDLRAGLYDVRVIHSDKCLQATPSKDRIVRLECTLKWHGNSLLNSGIVTEIHTTGSHATNSVDFKFVRTCGASQRHSNHSRNNHADALELLHSQRTGIENKHVHVDYESAKKPNDDDDDDESRRPTETPRPVKKSKDDNDDDSSKSEETHHPVKKVVIVEPAKKRSSDDDDDDDDDTRTDDKRQVVEEVHVERDGDDEGGGWHWWSAIVAIVVFLLLCCLLIWVLYSFSTVFQ
jgi:hypothetical protein